MKELRRFKCGSTQFHDILKKKDELGSEWVKNGNDDRKRRARINSYHFSFLFNNKYE